MSTCDVCNMINNGRVLDYILNKKNNICSRTKKDKKIVNAQQCNVAALFYYKILTNIL